MDWLHTWAGVVLGGLLFVIFWMGTLSVFDREIDRWMMPDTRLTAPSETVSLDRVVREIQAMLPEDATLWQFALPNEREPVIRFYYRVEDGGYDGGALDPRTGALLPDQGTEAGSGFIFPFHFSLHLRWKMIGYWLVGLAGMAMMALLVSGVVIHRKIFVDFFTFRPRKKLPRSSLDLHNVTSVLALPFHFIITLSGLIIFFGIYFPTISATVYSGDEAAFRNEAFGFYQRAPADAPAGEPASFDAMAAEAKRRWDGDAPHFVRVRLPGDENAYVAFRRNRESGISLNLDLVVFDVSTGAVLHEHSADPMVGAQRFIAGMHFIQFRHWPLRWIYFALGLSGCVMIATGYIYWLETRRKRHAKLGLPGVRIVETLTIGAVTGVIAATLAFFVVNRLLPLGTSFAGFEREALEIWAFYLVWLTTFIHAWARPGQAWREQSWTLGALAIAAVVLNWITTGDHILAAATRGIWAVAGMDILLLAGAGLAVMAALKLQNTDRPVKLGEIKSSYPSPLETPAE